MLWPGNSPDLNAIEPAWFWLKRRTTQQGAPSTRAAMKQRWYKAWKDLPQEQIQKWIEAIPHHIQEIIRCEGGNEYQEGRKDFKRSFAGRRIKGKLSAHQFIDKEAQHKDEDWDSDAGEIDTVEEDDDEEKDTAEESD
jgi:hypothetical protein